MPMKTKAFYIFSYRLKHFSMFQPRLLLLVDGFHSSPVYYVYCCTFSSFSLFPKWLWYLVSIFNLFSEPAQRNCLSATSVSAFSISLCESAILLPVLR